MIYGAILQAVGINPADLLANPGAALDLFTGAATGDGGAFDIPDIPDASGYATVKYFDQFRGPDRDCSPDSISMKLTWLKKPSITATLPLLPGTWWTETP